MSKRQELISLKLMPDLSLRFINGNAESHEGISEWLNSYIGDISKTLTSQVPKVIDYIW